MIGLYKFYLQERENFEAFEHEDGFAIYQISGNTVYIRDIYVVPEKRKDGIASYLADEVVKIAKKQGCKTLIGSVAPHAEGSTNSVKVLLAYGFQMGRVTETMIYFLKEI